jgi:hypothetical protein
MSSPSSTGAAPRLEDLPRLGDTRRVIEETLRLYPPTWLTARSPGEDDSIDGYVIRAGALVLLSPYLTHRHPEVWDDPERFDPDRFMAARAAMRPAFCLLSLRRRSAPLHRKRVRHHGDADDRRHRGSALPAQFATRRPRLPRPRAHAAAKLPLPARILVR